MIMYIQYIGIHVLENALDICSPSVVSPTLCMASAEREKKEGGRRKKEEGERRKKEREGERKRKEREGGRRREKEGEGGWSVKQINKWVWVSAIIIQTGW